MIRIRRLKYKVGSIIRYSAFGGLMRTVLVEEKDSDIKNGRPGFSGVLVNPQTFEPLYPDGGDYMNGVWGYDDQITRVLRQ